ncbi:RluA family pseudouridine synthase [Glutamicibacter sp. NPDC090743]|uniref:RluA family pseudouridine synthase n=1 Tax=Glutamicibacter sp. NPDC090743 TaxID=3364001 RepID=UPI00381EE1E0
MSGVLQQPASEQRSDSKTRTILVDGEHAGRRIEKFLRVQLKTVPAGQLFRLMRKGQLRVNGKKVQEGYRLAVNDQITLPALYAEQGVAPAFDVPAPLLNRLRNCVLHEDRDVLVIDKPAGVAVHRGTDVPAGVIEAFRQLRPELPDLELSHRLDRDTSGLLVLAKTPSMLRYLHEMLRESEEEIERHYLALVAGHWSEKTETIHSPLLRRADKVVVDPNGQRAETHVTVKQRVGQRATILDVQLMTGRKHQIRVHLQSEGHPIAGDDRYGFAKFNRRVEQLGGRGLFLHATKLVIPKPDGQELVIEAPMPQRWKQLLKAGL